MKVNTGIALVACGVALMILAGRVSMPLERTAQALAVSAALLGLATLAEYLAGWNLGIDELLVRDRDQAYNLFRGRMSPLSAAAFVALGCALAAMPSGKLKMITTFGAVTAVSIAAVPLLGYLWNAGELVTDSWLPPVALNTAVCFLLLGGGILVSPRRAGPRLADVLAVLPAVEVKTLAGFTLAVALLLIGGGLTYRTEVLFAKSVEWVSRTQEVRAALAGIFGSLAGAELAERDYFLTADPTRLEEHRRLVDEVRQQLMHLDGLVADDPVQQRNSAALRAQVFARLGDIAQALEAYGKSGIPAARAVLAEPRGVDRAWKARNMVEHMEALEASYLSMRQAAVASERRSILVSMLVAVLAACAVFVGLFRGIHREMSARRVAENHLRQSNQFLDSLIDNLPLMVVLKDAATLKVARHNRAFERLLGYRPEELAGKTPHELFSAPEAELIAATDREALQSGRLVEIPEQSILIPRLGTRTFYTMKMPIGVPDSGPQYLLTILVDITERKLAEQLVRELNTALQTKADQLETTNKELESFSYSVSHDLRAPLRAIDGFAMMIEEDCAERLDAEGRRYLSVIRENSKRMGSLIDDLLAFSRLGRLPVVTREVNMESLVREVIEAVLGSHAGAAPAIDVGALPFAHADPALLRQVWTNLIANAVKYSGHAARPHILISGECNGAENCYSVRDNGVGFDMRYVDKLFGVFQRLHRADEFSGTGVGLAIVHRVVTRHGGRVWAEGEPGRGAVFSFALPARAAHDGA